MARRHAAKQSRLVVAGASALTSLAIVATLQVGGAGATSTADLLAQATASAPQSQILGTQVLSQQDAGAGSVAPRAQARTRAS